jgi:hemolysin III
MDALFEFPSYTNVEKRVDAVIHVAGVAAAIGGGAWLLTAASGFAESISLAVYAIGLIATLTISALYNLTPASRLKSIFRRADHATIYAMIACTYTPFSVNRLDGATGLAIGLGVWLAAAIGIFLALKFPRRYERFKMALYLAMGWFILPGFIPLYHAIAFTTLWLLLAGGIVYSLGAGIYLLRHMRFHNAIWHAMVLVAASLHYTAMVVEFSR